MVIARYSSIWKAPRGGPGPFTRRGYPTLASRDCVAFLPGAGHCPPEWTAVGAWARPLWTLRCAGEAPPSWHEDELAFRRGAPEQLVRPARVRQRQALGNDRVDLVGAQQS